MRNPPPAWRFFALTFALSWSFWIAAALIGQPVRTFPTIVLHTLGGFAPSLTAIWLLTRREDKGALRDLWRRLIEFRRISWGWYVLICLFFPVVFAIAYAINRAFGGQVPAMVGLNQIFRQPIALLPTIILGLITGPLSEELGWRGYALDRLQARWRRVWADLGLAFVWWIWHLPLFYIRDTTQYEYGVGTPEFWLFALNSLPLTVLITRAYNANDRSVLSAVLIHFALNYTFGLFYPVSVQFDLIRTLVMVVGVAIVLLVTSAQKQEAPGIVSN